jgi:hypothetical protein
MKNRKIATQLQRMLQTTFAAFSNRINFTDWHGQAYSVGIDGSHWRGVPLEIAGMSGSPGMSGSHHGNHLNSLATAPIIMRISSLEHRFSNENRHCKEEAHHCGRSLPTIRTS